ncbi:hypothetical protein EYF80_044815 [Liparis tanakae]|uniref:Uncharacterized protein n=1 Tax=Liparis tanakae TaxID=230148 RepID=A0A4Z2FVC1_9TELE|nr:hypothetical protein EYF80_044815 [Liparis tanakae]
MHRSDRRRSISADIAIIDFDGRSQTDRSDDVTSARNTIRDVSIAARRNGDDAPAECRRVRGPRGDPPAASGVPSPELNLWVNSPTLACLSPYRLMFTAHAFHRELPKQLPPPAAAHLDIQKTQWKI